MARLSLIRIDNRLIHGQVMAMWSKEYAIDHILIIDDPLSKDPFMKKVYGMAVPSSIKFDMLSVDDAARCWKDNQLDSGNYLVLIKDPETAHRVWKSGFGIEKLQIGNLEAGPDSVILHKSSRLSREHLPYLIEMLKGGIDVYIQPQPAEGIVPLANLLNTLNK